MKVIIAGSRKGFTADDVHRAIKKSSFIIDEVVSGTSWGVDRLGEDWAEDRDIPVQRFPADWDKYGKSAGHKRNREMGDYADCLLALWDGESKGTKGMIEYMTKLRKPVYVYYKGE